MNATRGGWFSRQLLWKEYRQLRPFWLAMAGLTVLAELVAHLATAGRDVLPVYWIAIGLPAFYALGCGATMFAGEHEGGTYQWLRALPLTCRTTYFTKVLFALVSIPALYTLTWIAAVVISRFTYPGGEHLQWAWGLWGFAAVEFLAWSMLFSLLMRHALRAAILGAAGASFSVFFLGADRANPWAVYSYTEALPVRVAVAAAVAAITYWLGRRWYRERAERRAAIDVSWFDVSNGSMESVLAAPSWLGGRGFVRLLWLQWRQSFGWLAIATAMVVPLVLALIGRTSDKFSNENLALYGVMAMIAFPLAGAAVLAGDQRRRHYRFLTERGVTPGTVWWSRQLVWMTAICLWCVAIWSASVVPPLQRDFTPAIKPDQLALGLVLFASLSYSVGQFCCMVFRSSILAGTLAVLGAALVAAWGAAMAALNVPLIWSVGPLPVMLLLATRLRTQGWMLDRNTWRSWWPPVLVTMLPTALLVAAVCSYRAWEIPAVDSGVTLAEVNVPVSPAARQTLVLYQQAYDLMEPWEYTWIDYARRDGESEKEHWQRLNQTRRAAEDRWVATNGASIALTLQASRSAECDPDIPGRARGGWRGPERMGQELSRLVFAKGRALEQQGELDGAAEHYLASARVGRHLILERTADMDWDQLVNWAAHDQQTGERVSAFTRALEAEFAAEPVLGEIPIILNHLTVRRWIDGDLDDMLQTLGGARRSSIGPAVTLYSAVALYWFPWERTRAGRSLDQYTAHRWQRHQELVREWTAGGLMSASYRAEAPWSTHTPLVDMGVRWNDFASSGDVGVAWRELRRRACLVRLALLAWRLHHGRLPESLDPLAGSYLTRVPLDPASGQPFVYFPQGLTERIVSVDRSHSEEDEWVRVEAGQPFVWSPSWRMSVLDASHPVYKYRSAGTTAVTAHEVWARGEIFAIP